MTDEEKAKAANDRLLQKRAENEAQKHDGVTSGDSLENATLRLLAIADNDRKFRLEFEQWFHKARTRVKWPTCEKHGIRREPDLERSLKRSREAGMNGVSFSPCPKCLMDEQIEKEREWLLGRGVPGNMAHCHLENWEPSCPKGNDALAAAREFKNRRHGFIALSGPEYGIGKSHLGIAILRDHGKGMFITQLGLMARVRAHYNTFKETSVVEDCKHTPLLILDEVGFGQEGRDVLPILHEILDFRYGMRKKTVLTTNLSRNDFANAIGERLADRLGEALIGFFELTGKSRRKANRSQYHHA